MRATVIFLLLSVFVVPRTWAGFLVFNCPDALKHLSGESYKTAYINGVLVETRSGTKAFGFNDYVSGGHSDLLTVLRSKYGIKKILWGGEVEVVNGVAVRANETSGYIATTIARYAKGSSNREGLIIDASVAHFEEAMRASFQEKISSTFNPERYSPDDEHLDPRLNLLTGDLKHQIAGTIMGLLIAFEKYSKPELVENISQDVLQNIWEKTQKFIVVAHLMEQQGDGTEGLEPVLAAFKEWKTAKDVDSRKFKEFMGPIDRLGNRFGNQNTGPIAWKRIETVEF